MGSGRFSFSLLFVEDEDFIREPMSRILGRWIPELHVATNGLEGWEKFRQIKPRAVVTDIRMPDMDGLELAEKILREAPDTYVIILSGHNEAAFKETAYRLGVKEFLLKPLDVELLLAHLTKIQAMTK